MGLEFNLKWLPWIAIFGTYYHYIFNYTLPLILGNYSYTHVDERLPAIFKIVDILEEIPLFFLPIFEDQNFKKGINMFLTTNFLFLIAFYSWHLTAKTNPGKIPENFSQE